jgi:hypothetical protein
MLQTRRFKTVVIAAPEDDRRGTALHRSVVRGPSSFDLYRREPIRRSSLDAWAASISN